MSHPTRSLYFVIFAALLGLLFLTVGVAYLHLGAWAVVAAMTIAISKAVLIILYFMHVRYEVPLVRVFAAAGFAWVGLMLLFLFADYTTRSDVIRYVDPDLREISTPAPATSMIDSPLKRHR